MLVVSSDAEVCLHVDGPFFIFVFVFCLFCFFFVVFCFFFFNDTATTEIYTLSLTRRSSDLWPLAEAKVDAGGWAGAWNPMSAAG